MLSVDAMSLFAAAFALMAVAILYNATKVKTMSVATDRLAAAVTANTTATVAAIAVLSAPKPVDDTAAVEAAAATIESNTAELTTATGATVPAPPPAAE